MTADDFQPSLEYAHDSYPGEAAACAALVSDAVAAVSRLAQLTGNLTDTELTAVARSLALINQQICWVHHIPWSLPL